MENKNKVPSGVIDCYGGPQHAVTPSRTHNSHRDMWDGSIVKPTDESFQGIQGVHVAVNGELVTKDKPAMKDEFEKEVELVVDADGDGE